MSPTLKLILMGLPGSGKTTFGKRVARELNFTFLDLDKTIEKETGRKISDIFQEEGEGKFRELERLYLEKLLDGAEGLVLATGGGTPCFFDNIELINDKGISVYLDASLDVIFRRLLQSKAGHRPMFAGLDEGEIILKLKNLLAEREYFYNQAKIKLSGEDISTEHLVSQLIGRL